MSNVLVAYFSASGVTKSIAEKIANENDYDILTQNGYYIKKIDYTIKEYEDIINEAKKYYYSYRVISNETDMSDRYHSDNTYYYSVNMTNVLVKDKKFYGVILHGLEAIHSYYLIATIKNIQTATDARQAGTYGIAEIEESRTIGYFLTLEDAKRVVKNNIGDLHEDYDQ